MGQNSASMREHRRNRNKGKHAGAELSPSIIRHPKAPSEVNLDREVGNLPSEPRGSVKRFKA